MDDGTLSRDIQVLQSILYFLGDQEHAPVLSSGWDPVSREKGEGGGWGVNSSKRMRNNNKRLTNS